MDEILLQEAAIFPSKQVLQSALGEAYLALEALETQLTQPELALTFNWHYYKDSKARLCKVAHKKKTIFWLSVWKSYFKTSFFFLERHLEGIAALKLDKNRYLQEKERGNMIPFIFTIRTTSQFPDLLKLVKFKKG